MVSISTTIVHVLPFISFNISISTTVVSALPFIFAFYLI